MTKRTHKGQRAGGLAAEQGLRTARAKPVGVPYPMELRLRVVRGVEAGAPVMRLGKTLGISVGTIHAWLKAYRTGGVEALVPGQSGPAKRQDTPARKARRQAVTAVRQEHPEYGTRRIQAVLSRFEGLGVSETEVRRILHEEGLIPETQPKGEPHEHGPRRFERAEPNQLWQSDIFTFLLRRHERLYLAGFMDDHSRFIVSHALAHHQRSSLVMEALRRGMAAYGNPREILTDQGRQYTAWRGSTEFEEELRPSERLPSSPGGPEDARGPGSPDSGGSERQADGEGSSGASGDFPKAASLPDESGIGSDDRGDRAAPAWPPAEARQGAEAGSGERAAPPAESASGGASSDGGASAGGSVGDAASPDGHDTQASDGEGGSGDGAGEGRGP
jgi:transposase InsO family protein